MKNSKVVSTEKRSPADSAKRRSKRNWQREVLIAGLLVVGLTFALSAAAGEGKGHRSWGGSGGWVEKHADELGIDEATLAEINQIVDSSREQGKAIYEEHRAARDAMRQLLDQDEPNFDAVMKQAEVIGEIDVRKHKHRVATMLEIRAKLTPEQRSQLRELKGEMHERDGKHRGHGRHHRGHRDRTDDAIAEDQ
jgi:Spy/CpxP family protein refolding chaperone